MYTYFSNSPYIATEIRLVVNFGLPKIAENNARVNENHGGISGLTPRRLPVAAVEPVPACHR